MQRLRWLPLILCLLATPLSLSAQQFVHFPVDIENLPGRCDFELFGEALYWAPNAIDFNYAELGTINPPDLYQFNAVSENLIAEVIDPSFDWGFRIGLRMNRDRWFAQAEFLWIEVENYATSQLGPGDNNLSIPELALTAGHATGFRKAVADLNTQYENASLKVGLTGRNNCRGWYEFYAAAETVWLRYRFGVTGIGEANFGPPVGILPIRGRYSKSIEMLALGAGSGLRGLAHLGGGFSVGGLFQAIATVSHVKTRFLSDALTPAQNFTPPPNNIYEDILIPTDEQTRPCLDVGVKGRANIQYSRCFGRYRIRGQLGYEANIYKIGFIGGPLASLSVSF